MIFLCILVVLWFATGVAAFIFTWTKDEDLTFGEIPLMIYFGCMGPIAVIVAFIYYSVEHHCGIILKKRK